MELPRHCADQSPRGGTIPDFGRSNCIEPARFAGETFEQPLVVKSANLAELINIETRDGFLVDFPLRDQFEAALDSRNDDWFDFTFAKDSSDDDEDEQA